MKKQILSAIAMLGAATCCSAVPEDLMIGARGYGFGGAYVAVVNDQSAAYWNPAGLSRVHDLSVMESNWIFQNVKGLNVNYLSAAIPVASVGTVNGSWLCKNATLESGDGATAASVGAVENHFSLSIGHTLWEKLSVFEKTSIGFSINRETFDAGGATGAGLGFDLGLLTDFPYGLSFGVTWRSLGTDMMGEKIDPELRFGIGYTKTINGLHRITIGADGLWLKNRGYKDASTLEPAENNFKWFGGVEYALCIRELEVAVRGGGNAMMYDAPQKAHNYNFGIGVKYLGYSFQYAFSGATHSDAGLGYSHRVDVLLSLSHLVKK